VRTIRWGILGTGSISDDFCEGLKAAPGSALHAVASRDPERARGFARRHGFQHALSLGELLKTDVDVVYVATPPPQHRAHAVACLEAGKAVLVEKPFASDAAEAKEIAAAARRHGRFCMEAMWMRFTPAVRALVTELQHGKHGRVTRVEASLGFPHADPASRGSAVLDLGVYALSFVHAVLGPARAVKALGGLEDASALLQWDGAQGVVQCSLKSALSNDAVIHTERARIHLEAPLYRPESYAVQELVPLGPRPAGAEGGAKAALKSVTQRPELRRWVQRAKGLAVPRVTLPASGNGYAHEAIEVNDCLRGGALESGVMPLDASLQVMELVDAIARECA
jgi:predicted dehydrogenase